MAWPDVYDYILRLAPDLREALVGVPEEHILACEQNWGLEIPPAYRDFLTSMGVDAGHFSPFPGREWNFYELLRDPPEDYRPQQFFRISVDTDDSLVTWSELYLDMATVRPGGDCDVVQVEWLNDPATSRPLTPRETFLERLLSVSWMALDGRRFAHDRSLFADKDAFTSIDEVLRRTGFSFSLPPETREAVWSTTEGAPATAHCSGGSISSVIVASDDEAFVRRVAQLLLDNVPSARMNKRSPSFFNPS